MGSKVTLRGREGFFPNFLEGTALLWPFSTLGTVPGGLWAVAAVALEVGSLEGLCFPDGVRGEGRTGERKGWQLVVA